MPTAGVDMIYCPKDGEYKSVSKNDSEHILSIKNPDKDDFANHGMPDLSHVNPRGFIKKKTYINYESEEYDDGLLMRQSVDLNAYSVQKISFGNSE